MKPRVETSPADVAEDPRAPAGTALEIHHRALRTPFAEAVVDGEVSLDYATLNVAAATVAQELGRRGVTAGQAVAVALPRSWRLVCVMLGILRLGAQVVPLDTQSPAERRHFILRDSAAVALVCETVESVTQLPQDVKVLAADTLLPEPPDAAAAVAAPSAPGAVSFLFYTSGTTGQPKGVEVRDAGVRRLAQPGYIRVEPGLRYACLANPAFDALSFEVWVPLLTGGCCVVLSDGDVRTPERLAAALRNERVDTVFITTALFNAMVTAVPDCFAAAGEVLVGGEQLNPRVMRRWYRDNADSGTRLFNIYGPTESTTFALCHPIPRDFDGDVVPIGRPLPQSGAVLVVPGQERVAAPGEVGELLLSGAGLAVGYRNLPEETERRFVRLPWLDGGEERYYRTGDLVRADSEGLVEYVGRTDRQVKVRGFRIEPGEVERRVLTHPAVQRAYVCTRRAGPEGPNELLAFVVLRQELSYAEFDSHLTTHLPAYMRPHQIHLVADLPLNANGKVDQAALLRQAGRPWRPVPSDSGGPAATETERRVVELAEEILGTTGLGLGDRWIASGGDSLKALRFCFAVRQRWGRELTQAAVLHGDLAAVARSLTTVRPGEENALPAPVISGARSAPATSEQQRLWLVQRSTPGSRAYSVNQAFRVDGPVDTAALRSALRSVVARHEALRTSFGLGPDGLEQTVGEPYDPWHEPGPQQIWDEEAAHAFADTFFAEPFDLAIPRMLRACWLPRDGGGTLLLHLHHIAVDGWSLSILLHDLSAAYAGSGRPEAPAPTPLDFAVWQSGRFASPAYQVQRDELLAFYQGLEEPQEPLPAQDAGPAPRARLLHTSLDVVRRAQVDRLCAEFGLTRFQVLLSVFSWCLYGVTGLVRPRIAAPVAGRPVREFENSAGMMANTVLLPLTVAPAEDLRSHLARTRTGTGQVLGRQDVALADVLTRWEAVGDSTPFDFLFVLENTDFGALRLPGCAQRPLWWAAPEAKCPMTVSVVEHADGLDVLWEYAEDRFTGEDVEAMAELLRRGVDVLAAGGRSTPRELVVPYRRSLPEHGRGPAPEPGFTTIAEGFGRQVARTPDAPAVVTADGGTLSYAALDARAAALATELADRYPIPADGSPCRAALYLDPSAEHVVALLALARLNVTAVPLDPSYPADVLRHVLEQIDPLCVLATRDSSPMLDTLLPGGVVRHLVVPADPVPRESDGTSAPYDRRPDDRSAVDWPAHDGTRPLYTLFTSGSTGVPKGVQIHDRTLCDLIRWQSGPGGLAAPAVTQQFSMLAFDVSFQEIFGTLCTGGSLHLIRPEWRQDVPALLDRLDCAGAERIFMPYVALHLLAEYAVRLNRYPSRLREVVTAGEQLVCTDSIRRWFAGLPGARLFNHYGPTETHVVSALCLEGDPGRWPERPAIGRPVAGADLRVVDVQGDPVPAGCTGELLIGGTMATRCYLGDPALDDTRFVELPGAGLFYRSGDRAFFDRAGLLHYAGRDDQQIKLSGHRLELGSVEAALLRHPAVVNAVVTRDGDRLTAGLEVRGETPSADDLTAHLSALLPSYIRVDRFRRLQRLPRTPSGKLDRQAVVREPGEEIRPSAIARTGLSAEEERLSTAFEEVTGSVIAPDQTFFEAGASSLALMRFHLHCTTALGLRFSVADLFEHVTVRSLARHLTAPRPLTPSAAKNAGPPEQTPEPGEPIAVVGMAVRVPGAADLAAFWELVVCGGTGIRRIDAPEGVVGAHSTLDGMLDFDPGHFGISPQEARLMDPQQRHLLMAGVQALAHAGVPDTSAPRVGLVAGAGENTYFQSLLREADPDRLPDGFQLALHHEKDFLATKVAYHLGLTGPAFSAQTACSSSLVAVHLAAGLLRQGEADVMLAGGVLVDPGLTGGYRYRPQHIFSADGDCRPFSDDATGTVGASGVGVVVLKTLRQARHDGDTVYALITGSAINNDGAAKMSYTAPSLAGQREVIRTALSRAGRTGADLGYVEAHGTGTRLGDPIEVGALRQAFDVSESGRCALSSVKSQLGHMGAAAGVVGLVRAVLAVHHGTLPPNLNFRAFNPEIGADPTPFHIPAEATPWPEGRERVAAVSSFGIGGTNAHVIVEQDTAPGPVAPREVPECLVLSASSADALAADAARIADHLRLHPERLGFVLRHLQAGRVARRLRAAAPVTDATAAEHWLRTVAAGAVPLGTADPDAVPVLAVGRAAHDLAQDWTAGRPVDWGAGSAPAPWDFPPPSFSLAEYDFDRGPEDSSEDPREAPAATPRRLPQENWLHQPHWVRLRRAAVVDAAVPAGRASAVVVVASENTPRTALAPFEAVASRVIRVYPAGAFARRGPDAYDVDPADPASLRRLLDALSEDGTPASADTEWVHALPLDVTGPAGPGTLEHARHTCLDSTAALAQALTGRNGSPRVWWLSYGARPVAGAVDRPELALLAGPVEVAHQESALNGHWLDLPDGDLTRWAGHVASVVAGTREAGQPGGPALPRQLALRQGYWWRPGTIPVPEPEGTRSLVPAGADTVHLVLGGTGGMGRAIAAWLLEHTGGRVLLLSRNPRMPEELSGWSDRVGLVRADLAAMPVHEVAAAVADHTSRLDGVVHAAGLGHGGLLVRRDATAMRDAAAVRERGALVVEHLIEAFRPEIAVYCSSMSALLGGVGQSDYAAGASLLDGFAHHRATETETTVRIGIDWDIWRETGMATRVLNTDSRHQAHLAVGLTVEEGKAVFGRALALQLPQLLVSTTDIDVSRVFYAAAGIADRSSGTGPVHPADGKEEASDAGSAGERAYAMARVIRDLLGVDELDPEDSLYDLGADSLTLISLIAQIEDDYGVAFDLASFSHRVSLTEILKHIEAALTSAEHNTERTTETAGSTSRVVLDIWQEGTGPAVLCLVHPVGGDIQAYRSLVAALGPAPTVCLIADPALRDTEVPAWSLAERAHHYDAELRARFGGPDHRLHLAGWSYGARVAMEMAGLAESAGRPLEALYLLDPPPPQAEALVAAYDEAHLEKVFAAELGTGASSLPTEHARAYAEGLARCCRANLRSLGEHRVRPLVSVPTYLWLAEHPTAGMPTPAGSQEPDRQWDTCLPPSAVRRYLPTDHYGIVAAPHVGTVAETIRATLASPGAGARGTADL
ncbi:amino acid adenylation domain-containing protein [Streptomyces sp. NPDC020298]|uniref:amino acid adenylation domain-containing protein n=1 Tax=unclassified Streptomyces TaxID=2593676 RepID=UPI0033CDD9C6